MAAVDDLHQATDRDLNLVVGQKLNTAVGGDLEERVQGIRRSIAPKTCLGSDGVNVLQVLCDLIEVVQDMNVQIASHVHASSLRRTMWLRSPLMRRKLRPYPKQ